MRKIFAFTVVLLSAFNASAQKQIFESPKLKTEVAKHKTVAILPYEVAITYKKQPKNFNTEANEKQEKDMAFSIQSSMHTFLLRKADNYSVSFQDPDKTNVLLRKNGMMEKMNEFTKDEIAKALGVDAIISGRFESEQSKSETAAVVSAIVFRGMGGKTGSGTLFFTVHNGEDGELLWRFHKTMDDNITASTDDLVEHMMRKVARNFPYSK